MPVITLPDGSTRRFHHPVSVAEIAASIGAGLAKAALAGKVDGVLVDTSAPVDHDARVSIVTERDPEGLEILRHSTAHLLANAVQELYPDAQVTIGPVIEDGFYYDFAYKRPFSTEDLAAIEKRMAEIAAKDLPVHRRVLPRDAAIEHFKKLGEYYKAEIIASIPSNEPISLYGQGDWEDLCRGPHVPSTGKLKAFKLMKVRALTGAATRATRCCSESTVPPGRARNSSRSISSAWRRRKSAIIGASARSWIFFICRRKHQALCSGIRRVGRCSSS